MLGSERPRSTTWCPLLLMEVEILPASPGILISSEQVIEWDEGRLIQ